MGNAESVLLNEPLYENGLQVFLLGKTGHGKSSTGNTIIGKSEFHTSDNAEADTNLVTSRTARRCGYIVTVVDSPGLKENRYQSEEATTKMINDMGKAMSECRIGFNAMLLVFRYGIRFTEEELSTVSMLKEVFGPDFIKEYCIVVFTHGENFDMANKDKTFSAWCYEQRGELQHLLQECDHRAVLFYNSDISSKKSKRQVKELLSKVAELKIKKRPYTNEVYQEAVKFREQLAAREKAPKLLATFKLKVDLLSDSLERVSSITELTPENEVFLTNLKNDVTDLEKEIDKQDSGHLDSMKQRVVQIRQNVKAHEAWLAIKKQSAESKVAHEQIVEKYKQDNEALKKELDQDEQRQKLIGAVGEHVGSYVKGKIVNTFGAVKSFFYGK